MGYRLTRRAREDVRRIWRYIADDNAPAADQFIDLLTHNFRLLGANPYAGRRRDELRVGLRSFIAREYLILYRIQGQTVVILHIVHGRRDLATFLGR